MNKSKNNGKTKDDTVEKSIPLAEKMRPDHIDDYVGQTHVLGKDTILRKVLDKNEVPSMILWGPPGCGKVYSPVLITTTANKYVLTKQFFVSDNIGSYHCEQMQTNVKFTICQAICNNGWS